MPRRFRTRKKHLELASLTARIDPTDNVLIAWGFLRHQEIWDIDVTALAPGIEKVRAGDRGK
jgi:hypothetical protein